MNNIAVILLAAGALCCGHSASATTFYIDSSHGNDAKTAAGVTTLYLVDDLNPTGYSQVVDELVNGSVQREYAYGLQRINEDQLIGGTWTPSFYGYDGGGSVRQLTNLAGAVTDTYNYDAFGNLLNSTGTTPNNYRYSGEQYDSDLSLYYLRARYYNPVTARFLSRDPENGIFTDPKTLHKYVYAGGDPVNFKDPTGRDFVGVIELDKNVIKAGLYATAITIAATCLLNDATTLLQGVNTNPGWQIASILPSGPCSIRVRKCRPCDPPVSAGDFGYRLDMNPRGPHHDKPTNTDIFGPHWHLYVCNQTPPSAGCFCSWQPLKIAAAGTLPYGFDIKTVSCSGGGIE
jgi:RHS repeat-associated protein